MCLCERCSGPVCVVYRFPRTPTHARTLPDELIRQVTLESPERGLLLLRVRDEIRMTLDAYKTLYDSRYGLIGAVVGVGVLLVVASVPGNTRARFGLSPTPHTTHCTVSHSV